MKKLKFEQRLKAKFVISKHAYLEKLKTLLVGKRLTRCFEVKYKGLDNVDNVIFKIGFTINERFLSACALMEHPESLFNIEIKGEGTQAQIDKLYEEYQNLFNEYANLLDDISELDDDVSLDMADIVFGLLRDKSRSNLKIKKLEKKLSRIEQVFDDTIEKSDEGGE